LLFSNIKFLEIKNHNVTFDKKVSGLKVKRLFNGLIALALFMITGCNIQG